MRYQSNAAIWDALHGYVSAGSLGSRSTQYRTLNILAWERESTGHDGDEMVLNGVKYGFPLQYYGGPIYTDNAAVQNHHSACHYPEAIQKHIEKEESLGMVIGPSESPPFTPWCHISPIMTRAKSDCNE